MECTLSFCDNAEVAGALIVLVTKDGNFDFINSSVQTNGVLNHTVNQGGEYKIHVYTIESNGILASGTIFPIVTHTLTTRAEDETSPKPQTQDSAYLQSCDANTFSLKLVVECITVNNDTVTGLQVTALSTEGVNVGRLYTNQSSDPQTPATVQLDRTGLYQVTVFPILGERGILDTSAEYSQQLMVGGMSSQDTTTTDVITTATDSTQGMHNV